MFIHVSVVGCSRAQSFLEDVFEVMKGRHDHKCSSLNVNTAPESTIHLYKLLWSILITIAPLAMTPSISIFLKKHVQACSTVELRSPLALCGLERNKQNSLLVNYYTKYVLLLLQVRAPGEIPTKKFSRTLRKRQSDLLLSIWSGKLLVLKLQIIFINWMDTCLTK